MTDIWMEEYAYKKDHVAAYMRTPNGHEGFIFFDLDTAKDRLNVYREMHWLREKLKDEYSHWDNDHQCRNNGLYDCYQDICAKENRAMLTSI